MQFPPTEKEFIEKNTSLIQKVGFTFEIQSFYGISCSFWRIGESDINSYIISQRGDEWELELPILENGILVGIQTWDSYFSTFESAFNVLLSQILSPLEMISIFSQNSLDENDPKSATKESL